VGSDLGSDLGGGCLCGAVRFRLSGTPRRVGLCHCLICRKETGGPFKHFAVYADSDVDIAGRTQYWTSPKGAERHFCPSCGSHLIERLQGTHEVEINVGCLDEPNHLPPAYEVWSRRRERWLPDLHLPRYPEDRPQSG